jgi:hypothetical protein
MDKRFSGPQSRSGDRRKHKYVQSLYPLCYQDSFGTTTVIPRYTKHRFTNFRAYMKHYLLAAFFLKLRVKLRLYEPLSFANWSLFLASLLDRRQFPNLLVCSKHTASPSGLRRRRSVAKSLTVLVILLYSKGLAWFQASASWIIDPWRWDR